MLDAHAVVDLAARGGADVVTLAGELAQVAQGVGAGGHGLGLERFDLVVLLGSHLARHYAAQVLLHRHLVDQVEQSAVVEIDQDPAAVALAADPDAVAFCAGNREPAPWICGGASALDETDRGIGDAAAVVDHEAADDADASETAQVALGFLAGGVVPDADAVEVDACVEGGFGGLAGLLGEAAGEVLGLALVAESGDLQAEEAFARSRRGRLDPQRGRDRHGLVLDRGGQPVLAAGKRHGLQVARQSDADGQGSLRSGPGLGLGRRRRLGLGRGLDRSRRGSGRLNDRRSRRSLDRRGRGPAGNKGQKDDRQQLLHR
jgi:hypothetical protein